MEKRRITKFELGKLVITPAAMKVLPEDEVHTALVRHAANDWGDVDDHDQRENELSLDQGFRLFSVYHTAAGLKFWVITEADRSSTCVLLPEDY